jgi:methylmalonyl-CoA carboxyltransferase 12S subunit
MGEGRVRGLEHAMRAETLDGAQVSEALEAVRRELARLGERVAALEAAAGVKPHPAAPPVPPTAAVEGLSEELLLVISVAVAAFLGEKPHIRQIRLIGTTAWAQQGRVTIQASHAFAARHGRS